MNVDSVSWGGGVGAGQRLGFFYLLTRGASRSMLAQLPSRGGRSRHAAVGRRCGVEGPVVLSQQALLLLQLVALRAQRHLVLNQRRLLGYRGRHVRLQRRVVLLQSRQPSRQLLGGPLGRDPLPVAVLLVRPLRGQQLLLRVARDAAARRHTLQLRQLLLRRALRHLALRRLALHAHELLALRAHLRHGLPPQLARLLRCALRRAQVLPRALQPRLLARRQAPRVRQLHLELPVPRLAVARRPLRRRVPVRRRRQLRSDVVAHARLQPLLLALDLQLGVLVAHLALRTLRSLPGVPQRVLRCTQAVRPLAHLALRRRQLRL
eukprot:Rhum_TRINITY_DN14246_c21_g1::Rhum_TRINITY_DN14246_c21_g1_i1::g.75818::m.75818